MSTNSSSPTRRNVLAASAAAGAVSLLPMRLAAAGGPGPTIERGRFAGDLRDSHCAQRGSCSFGGNFGPAHESPRARTGSRPGIPHTGSRGRPRHQGARVQECRPRLFHFPRRRGPDQRVPGGGGETRRRSIDRPPVSLFEHKPSRHDCADRGARARRRQRVRAGVRHALCRARVSDIQSAGAGVRSASRRRRRSTSRAPHGARQGA